MTTEEHAEARALGTYLPRLTELRRRIHRRPELGWTEFETTWLVAEELRALGWTVRAGKDVIEPSAVRGRSEEAAEAAMERVAQAGVPEAFLRALGGFTGAVGELDTGRSGPLTVLRFDMDCVAVTESADPAHVPAAEGFASTIPGSMHACGHDAHTAVGLTLARWIADHAEELSGRFRLLFQPAEEGTRGGAAMAAAGLVDDADYFFGSHVGMVCRTGKAAVLRGGFLATSKIDLHFEGKPSHVGAEPEKGRSALLAAAAASLMIQGISRHGAGDTRVSIGRLVAGEGRNVTPAHAKLELETRGGTHEVNQFLVENVRNMAEGAANAYGVKATMEIVGEATTLLTTEKGVALLQKAAESVYGDDQTVLDKVTGSEDCTTLMRRAVEKGADGAFLVYGCALPKHHQSDFDLSEKEDLLPGLAVLTALVRETNPR